MWNKRTMTYGTILWAGLLLSTATTTLAEERPAAFEGEIVQVREQVRGADGTLFDEATVRTRTGETVRIRLGENPVHMPQAGNHFKLWYVVDVVHQHGWMRADGRHVIGNDVLNCPVAM